jgi:hypothetical protein
MPGSDIPPQFMVRPHPWSRPLAAASVAAAAVGIFADLPVVLLIGSGLLVAVVLLNLRRYRRPWVISVYLLIVIAVAWAGWWFGFRA